VLENPAANGACGPWLNTNFGNPFNTARVNPDIMHGWGGLLTYTIPKIDVLVSGILRSQANTEPGVTEANVATNGSGMAANYTVTPAILAANGQTPFAPGVTTVVVDELADHLARLRAGAVTRLDGDAWR